VTPTSTDLWAADGDLDEADRHARQRRRFVALVVVLALVCTVFGVLTHLQGPKLAVVSTWTSAN
jgi:hypothetical protein